MYGVVLGLLSTAMSNPISKLSAVAIRPKNLPPYVVPPLTDHESHSEMRAFVHIAVPGKPSSKRVDSISPIPPSVQEGDGGDGVDADAEETPQVAESLKLSMPTLTDGVLKMILIPSVSLP